MNFGGENEGKGSRVVELVDEARNVTRILTVVSEREASAR